MVFAVLWTRNWVIAYWERLLPRCFAAVSPATRHFAALNTTAKLIEIAQCRYLCFGIGALFRVSLGWTVLLKSMLRARPAIPHVQ
ncbi:MAG: hypothetical protein ABIO59_08590 [Luteimonas sp.]